MTTETYKASLEQAKADLAEQIARLGAAQETAEDAEKKIIQLRQTIAALARLCGEPEYSEEDALGLTDSIRAILKATEPGIDLSAQDVKQHMESMGYAGRWGNVLASIHTVLKRLHDKKEIEAGCETNGRPTYHWTRPSLASGGGAAGSIRNATSYRSNKLRG
jgi:hypothetical protein